MRYLLDASALLPVVTKQGRDLLDRTLNDWFATTDLAIYEASNGLWKMVQLLKQLSLDDAKEILSVIHELVSRDMFHLLSVTELETAPTLEMAVTRKWTYYDASYVSAAKQNRAVLVTGDRALAESARGLVQILAVEKFQQKLR